MANTHIKNMLHVVNYQENVNKNCNEISPYTSQIGDYQKEDITSVGKDVEKREFLCTSVGM